MPLVTIYGIAPKNPNRSPNTPARVAHIHTEFVFRKSHVTNASNGHRYKYMIHHMPNPNIMPSSRINAGITNRILFPKYNVNIIIQKVVNSMFGISFINNLHTSITATIRPISVISWAVSFILLFSIINLYSASVYTIWNSSPSSTGCVSIPLLQSSPFTIKLQNALSLS